MYETLKILIPIICIKEDIIKYFQDNNIMSLENGIKTKDLPKEIVKNPYLLMMVQDKTLIFQKGKYYLNK